MLNRVEHEKQMSQILSDIYSDKSLSKILGFKGGTAGYFFYNLPRFSTDLDFNLLDLEKRDYVYEKLAAILANHGDIKDRKIKTKTIYFALSYDLRSQNIKIEVSLRQTPIDTYELHHLLGLPVLTMTRDCFAAYKLTVIFDRKRLAHRDLFDAWFLLKKNWPINEEIIKDRTGMSKRQYLAWLAKKIEQLGKINILHGLGEVLNHHQKIWTQKNLVSELVFLLKMNSK